VDIGWITITIQLPSQLVPFASGAEPPNGTNFAHIKNADYTRLVTQAATKPGDTGCPQWNAAEVALVKQSDFVPYYDSVAPTWTNKATYKDIGGGPVPTSLRLLAVNKLAALTLAGPVAGGGPVPWCGLRSDRLVRLVSCRCLC